MQRTRRRDVSRLTCVGGGRGARGVLGRSVRIVSLLSADIPGDVCKTPAVHVPLGQCRTAGPKKNVKPR